MNMYDKKPDEILKIKLISFAVTPIIKLAELSANIKSINFKPEVTPAIYAVWHGWQYNLGCIFPREKLNILISQSNDGEIVAQIAQNFGLRTIRGSMGRGGMKATREILKALEEGQNVAYTVDGPRGPGFKVKEGVIRIAQISQKPIIPVYGDATFRWEFNSWDNYQVPLPFSKIPMNFGEPIVVPEGDEYIEEYRHKLEDELLRMKAEARQK